MNIFGYGAARSQEGKLCRMWFAVILLAWSSAVVADQPAPSKSIAKYEIRFMENMIDHHTMALEMARICLTNAVHPELRTMCEQVIAAQQEEISMLQSWLGGWYGMNGYQPKMSAADMKQLEQLRALSGAEFEITFMRQLIQHHQRAIRMAATCTKRASHPDLVDMCEQIIEAQAAEIVQLRTWLCQWYGLCDRRSQKVSHEDRDDQQKGSHDDRDDQSER